MSTEERFRPLVAAADALAAAVTDYINPLDRWDALADAYAAYIAARDAWRADQA